MIKTILVPTSGTTADNSVFATALAIAVPMGAHMDFYHVRLSEFEAAVRSPHLQFCPASVLNPALAQLQGREGALSAAATQHVRDFCEINHIATRERATLAQGISARRLEEIDRTMSRFVFHARHRDLSVLGRPHTHDQIRDNLIESVLKKSGRPVVIATETPPRRAMEKIVIAWNESSAATRALAAALPLLKVARTVVLLGIDVDDQISGAFDEVARYLEWHGVSATIFFQNRSPTHPPAAVELLNAAQELDADLFIAGGYGHMPLREIVFGGVTQSLIERAAIPVMLMR